MANLVPDTEENAKLCPCPDCPTYQKSNFSGTLFCARGKAKEEVKSESCPCPSCPIFIKYNLKNKYYCIKGKAS
jgi:hypothetical protein